MSKKSDINPDNPLTDEEFDNLEPWKFGIESLPTDAQNAIKNSVRGRPKLEHPKEKVTLRMDADIVKQLRESGPGWQTRLNEMVRNWLNEN
ncbi:MAG: BrnA antitoxin family protein [Pseudomonadota bacterium]